jgi:Flp pilus assembly pilin Flp
MQGFKGQTLPEYCLGIGLISLVAVAGLSPLGQALFSHFSHTGGQAASVNQSLKPVVATAIPLNTSATLPVNQESPAAGQLTTAAGNTTAADAPQASTGTYQAVTATLKNGATLNLGKYPSDAAQLVETAGISGATQYMVGLLQNVAQQLQASGSITEAQYNSLINLSNKGHDIGSVQAELEVLLDANGGSLVSVKDQPMKLLGKSSYADGWFEYTVKNVVQSLGSSNTGPYGSNINIDWLTSFDTATDPDAWANPMYNNFMNAYKTAKADGSLSDPVVKQIVDDLAFKILIAGEVMEERGDKLLKDEVKSAYTHYNSMGICSQGNGKDSGVQCSAS